MQRGLFSQMWMRKDSNTFLYQAKMTFCHASAPQGTFGSAFHRQAQSSGLQSSSNSIMAKVTTKLKKFIYYSIM